MSSLIIISIEIGIALGIHSWLGWPVWISAVLAFTLENILGTICATRYWPGFYSSLATHLEDPVFRFWFRITRLFEVLVVYVLTAGVLWLAGRPAW
jgi:hypothetical protein